MQRVKMMYLFDADQRSSPYGKKEKAKVGTRRLEIDRVEPRVPVPVSEIQWITWIVSCIKARIRVSKTPVTCVEL